jgi:hypothetical protein
MLLSETVFSLCHSAGKIKAEPKVTCTYLSQLIALLKNTGPTILLALKHTRDQLSLAGAGHRELDVDSVNSGSDYFAYLCIPESETMLHQKRMSIVD